MTATSVDAVQALTERLHAAHDAAAAARQAHEDTRGAVADVLAADAEAGEELLDALATARERVELADLRVRGLTRLLQTAGVRDGRTVRVRARRPMRLRTGAILHAGQVAILGAEEALPAAGAMLYAADDPPPPWWPRTPNFDAGDHPGAARRR